MTQENIGWLKVFGTWIACLSYASLVALILLPAPSKPDEGGWVNFKSNGTIHKVDPDEPVTILGERRHGPITTTIGPTSTTVTVLPNRESCKAFEDFGYANGAIMAQRILGENESLKEMSWPGYDPKMTCEQVVKDLFDSNIKESISL